MQKKYIFITGGVCSSLGKGLTAASVGMLLERKNFRVGFLKLDPYLNVDPGTMNPLQHGEVYVTDDGAETDLDLGHYSRFTNAHMSAKTNATSGQIYYSVIRKERQGDYMGSDVQVIPHVTEEIKKRIHEATDDDVEIVLVEIGGTVGDIESLPFIEAIRQFRLERPKECLNIHLAFIPYLRAAGEWKTKPTQHSVQVLRSAGLFPDIILCRCEAPLPPGVKEKVSLFCNVPLEGVIEEEDVQDSIYEVPMKLHEQGLDGLICRDLDLPERPSDFSDWNQLLDTIRGPKKKVTVGIVGKYLEHKDAYKSVFEALTHGALANGVDLQIKTFEADKIPLDEQFEKAIEGCDGYLVPGGFGERGWNGKIMTAKYCREKKLPYFGICLGMQVMAVESARNVANLADANSTEFDSVTKHPIISLLSEQRSGGDLGGTLRRGAYSCRISEGSKAHKTYGEPLINERHRHRYEFNNAYQEELEKAGIAFSGWHEEKSLAEIIERTDHPWMIGVQFHPEFCSKPNRPHPLFANFVKAMLKNKESA